LPFREQKGYTPDPDQPLYFGIQDDAEEFVNELHRKCTEQGVYDEKGHQIWLASTVADGTPIVPKAASAPRQYARMKTVKYNQTTELEVWEWCVSVKGEPNRGRTASVYVDKFDMLVMHGGLGYRPDGNHHPSNATASPVARVLGDLWVLMAHDCAHNCSGNGVCTHGRRLD
jgi:hypothetical protein